MTGGQIRMVKIIGRVVNHTDSFHDPPRRTIVWDGKGDNFFELQYVEPECQGSPGTFGRVAAPPKIRGETPPDFRARRKRCFEAGSGKTDEADEWRNAWNFDGPETPTLLTDMVLNPFGKNVAFFSGEQRRKVFHDPRIRI